MKQLLLGYVAFWLPILIGFTVKAVVDHRRDRKRYGWSTPRYYHWWARILRW